MGAYRTRLPLVLDPLGTCFGKPARRTRVCDSRSVFDSRVRTTRVPILRSTDGVRSVSGRDLYDALGVGNASFRSADPATVYDGGV
jgi:hypothetical protein